MSLIQVGYYIVEAVPKPHYISYTCEQILSISECISEVHPSLEGCFWANKQKEQKKYQSLLKLSDDEFICLKQKVGDLFNNHMLDCDSCFKNISDALEVYQKYLKNVKSARMVGISIEEAYLDLYIDELDDSNITSRQRSEVFGSLLGYEILGWDYGSFHSYLCNGLEEDIERRCDIQINHMGLIQNCYEEVEQFVKIIEGKGEPVVWLPFAIHDCSDMM